MQETTWASRLSDLVSVPARDLLAKRNPENWRGHPEAQREVMRQVLDRVGWVAPVLVSRKTGLLLDGEMRVELAAERGFDITVQYVLLDEEEERVALATFDAMGEMAVTDEARLHQLLEAERRGLSDGPLVRKFTPASTEQMVRAVAGGGLLANLWMAGDGAEDEGNPVMADDYECFWVRSEPGVDEDMIAAALRDLIDAYDVRVEGAGFERLS